MEAQIALVLVIIIFGYFLFSTTFLLFLRWFFRVDEIVDNLDRIAKDLNILYRIVHNLREIIQKGLPAGSTPRKLSEPSEPSFTGSEVPPESASPPE